MNILLIILTSFIMNYSMPTLPYSKDALAPIISQETIDYHYGKHLQTYVNNLNALVSGTPFEGKTVEEIVINAPDGAIFNNAGQVLNHTLYFLQFTPQPEKYQPEGKLAEAIQRDFGNFENFKNEMTQAASSIFGSGWAWLAQDKDGRLHILQESNAGNPMRSGYKPLMTIDVWEHAYYIDYRNKRAEFVNRCWELFDWDKVVKRMPLNRRIFLPICGAARPTPLASSNVRNISSISFFKSGYSGVISCETLRNVCEP